MTSVEHQATVDRGLKMKIKRKNIGAKSDSKHEIVKSGDGKISQSQTNSNGIMLDKSKNPCDKDKSPRSKVLYNKKEKTRDKIVKCDPSISSASISNGLDAVMGQLLMEPRIGETPVKKDNPMPDPYEFNAKVEDGIAVNPIKKIKVEKVETVSSPGHLASSHSDTGTEMCTVGVNTQPECLGPCEPGTSVMLEGIVWNETENGVLVVNVTWRGKTYVGTLLDATKHDWAPPRFSCDSPVSEFETRTPKGRGKRGRAAAVTPVLERGINEGRKLRKGRRGSSISTFQAPPSPAKSDISTSSGVKRKGRPADIDLSSIETCRPSKRSRSSSRGTPGTESPPALIQCPERNCSKKYKHINGLRYHQTHAHQGSVYLNTDGDEDMKDVDSVEDCVDNVDSNKKDQYENVISTSAESKTKKTSGTVNKTNTPKQDTPEKVQTKPEQSKEDSSNSKPDEESAGNKKDVTSLCTSTVTTTDTPVVPKISVPVPQLYQITAAPIACLGGVAVVSQVANPGVSSSSLTTCNNSHVVATVPITVTTVTAAIPHAMDLKTDIGKSDKNADRIKSKPASARPIVPAPSPQMIALTSNVTVTSSTLAPVTTQTPVSPQLKPIQPKPTIMGDPTSVNPALASLKDNKKSKPKKKAKEKEAYGFTNNGKAICKDESSKCDRPAVIKSAPSPGKPVMDRNTKKDVPILESSRTVCDIPKVFTASAVNVPQNQPKGMDLSQPSRTLPPPNMLKVGSPLQVLTPDNRKTPVTDDVQSPAYSDISDANESGSPGQTESPHKHKEENTSKKEEREHVASRPQQQEGPAMSSPYGMYPYYGQSSYYGQSQNIPQSQVSKGSIKPQSVTKESPAAASSEEKKQNIPEERKTPIEKPSQTPGKETVKPKQDTSNGQTALNQQQMQEYQQKWYQHMYALQALPPHARYQYLAAYGYVDPSYHMQLYANDPQYRQYHEKVMEDEQKRQQDHIKPENEPGKLHDCPGQIVESRAHSNDSAVIMQVTPSKSVVVHASADKLLDLKKSTEKDIREQALKEKQNENHQILKENIDLKAQMDNKRYENEHYRNIRDKQAEDLRRLEMFQHQKMIEQQKRLKDSVPKSESKPGDIAPRNLSTTKQTADGAKGHSFQDQPRDLVRKDSANNAARTKEVSHSRDSSESKNHSHIDNKMTEEKLLSRTPSGVEKRKVIESSKSSKLFTPSKTVSPSNPSGNLNVSGSSSAQPNPVQMGSYAGNYMSYPYMQSPPLYGHFDPNMYRGMNPSMMYGGYPYSPQHIGYRVGNDVEEKEKTISATPQKQCSEPDVKSQSDMVHNSQYYGSGHKIHELEKTRPGSHNSSPLPTKSVDPPSKPSTPSVGFDKLGQGYTGSPPTQRHVHTHHHTHVVGGYPMYDPFEAVYASAHSQQ